MKLKTILFCIFLGLFSFSSLDVHAESSEHQEETLVKMKMRGRYDQIIQKSKNVFVEQGYIFENDWGGRLTFKRMSREFQDIYYPRKMWEYLIVDVHKILFHLYQLECHYYVAEHRDGPTVPLVPLELKALRKEYKGLLKLIQKRVSR